ncbi:hypothetical protein E4U53_007553 [Claviceps sorghi]|nr:hypothetical protein E4U53_007553 [Claviceps sorghi]
MGMQGPLTAQALVSCSPVLPASPFAAPGIDLCKGRSPYDDVVDGEGQDDGHRPVQQYDHRGRPVNPDTKRMNRDIIRAHNEVMLVIGVAEPETPWSGAEAESKRRHELHEAAIGLGLGFMSRTCVESVGIFGIHGLRQRILAYKNIYKRYSHIPFWGLFKQARADFSISRNLLAGAPSSLAMCYLEEKLSILSAKNRSEVARRIIDRVWSYVRVHLEIYVVLQRMGITPNNLWFPKPSFFIPFTEASPIPCPPPLRDFTITSLLSWVGGAVVSSAPLLVWIMTQRILGDFRWDMWQLISQRLPSTRFRAKATSTTPPPPPPPPRPPSPSPPPSNHPSLPSPTAAPEHSNTRCETSQGELESASNLPPGGNDETTLSTPSGPETIRRASVLSTRGDEFPSDDEENEGVSATLISFDVEASESQDAPPGIWSAELRPSAGPDTRSGTSQQPVYMDTLLTRLPSLAAANLLADAAIRILAVPCEATALRLVAQMFRLRQGLPCGDIFDVGFLGGVTSTWLVNFLGSEVLNAALCSEVWAALTFIFHWHHMSEDEWKEQESKGL